MDLTTAIKNDDYDTFLSLIEAGHDVNKGGYNHNIQGYSVYQAVVHADKRYLEVLLDHGVNYNVSTCCCSGSYHMIHFACECNRPDSVELLLSAGDNVNKLSIYDVTPLMYACKYGSIECIKVLIAHGADLYLTCEEVGSKQGNYVPKDTCLNFAIYYEQLEAMQTLFEHGFELLSHDSSICKCLVHDPNVEIFTYLMPKLDKYTLLAEVATKDNYELFKIMLDNDLFEKEEEEQVIETLIDTNAGECIYEYLENHCSYTYCDDVVKQAFNSGSKQIIEVLMDKGYQI